jgi:hypothetical protein
MGFLGLTIAILTGLALLSYSPHDPSFNVSADQPGLHGARNWIGPVGAYSADLLFQGLGYAAFLLPVGMLFLGLRRFRSETVDSPGVKIVGYVMLLLMLPTLLTLWHMPDVRGAIPPGGLLGHEVAAGLRAAFNTLGANLVAPATFIVALFMTTKFSFAGTHERLRGPLARLDFISPLRERYAIWRETREEEHMRQRLEQLKMQGRPPVPRQTVAEVDRSAVLDPEEEIPEEEPEAARTIVFRDPEEKRAQARAAAAARAPRGTVNFRLPAPNLLRSALRIEKLAEEDMKECALGIER